MFTSCWKPLSSFVSWLSSFPQWKVPTLRAIIMFGNINHTNLPFELPNDKTFRMRTKQNTQAEFHVKHWCLPPAPTGSAGCLMSFCSSQGVFKCTNWVMFPAAWDTFDELADMKTSTSLCVKICAPLQPLTGNCSFLRSRPRRSSILETSSRVDESRKITACPLLPLFYPSDSDCFLHGETLWAFKSRESYINLETKKTTFLPLSLFLSTLCFSLSNTHSGLETKLIKNWAE